MKSHEAIYNEEIAALKQAGVDKQSPEEVAAYLEKLGDADAVKEFVINCPTAEDGRLIFPSPVDGKYPVEFVAALQRGADGFLFAFYEFNLRWSKLPPVDADDPVEAFQKALAECRRLLGEILIDGLRWPEIDVRAVLSGECRDLDAVHKMMLILSCEEIIPARMEKEQLAQVHRMFEAVFDAKAEQAYIDRKFAALLAELDAAGFPAGGTREQALASWKLVDKLL